MRLGLVGQQSLKGLGTLTSDFDAHLPVAKILCLQKPPLAAKPGYAYANRHPTPKAIREFLDGLDAVIVLEVPLVELFRQARQNGVRSIMAVLGEALPHKLEHHPDVFLCSSQWHVDAIDFPHAPDSVVLLPFPVDTVKIPFKLRETATTFLHNAGTLGLGLAKGTAELLEAIPLVKNPEAKFLIQSRVPLPRRYDDPRIMAIIGDVPNYWKMCEIGDVMVMPHRFRGTCLGSQEAMAAGLPVMSTDIAPFNTFCQYLVPIKGMKPYRAPSFARSVMSAEVDPAAIAAKIDELVGTDITAKSHEARAVAEARSWTTLRDRYLEICKGV